MMANVKSSMAFSLYILETGHPSLPEFFPKKASQNRFGKGGANFSRAWKAARRGAGPGYATGAPCIPVACLIRWQTWRGESVTWQLFRPIACLFASLNPWKTRQSFVCSRKRITFA